MILKIEELIIDQYNVCEKINGTTLLFSIYK